MCGTRTEKKFRKIRDNPNASPWLIAIHEAFYYIYGPFDR
jgi:hypothetical protein